jgi:site-specific recombinase XerD
MRASNKSASTIATYGSAVALLGDFLTAHGYPTNIAEITPDHIEEWVVEMQAPTEQGGAGYKSATANNRWRGVQRFFSWAVDRDRLAKHPMAKLDPPKVEESARPILTIEQLKAVMDTTKGKRFEDVRDRALLRLMLDTGARRAEIARLRWVPDDPSIDDLNLDERVMNTIGKGKKVISIGLGKTTVADLDDYIYMRQRHPHADLPWLWLSRKGRLTDSGIFQVVRERGLRVGIPDLHPHDFRHADSHYFLADGGQETDLMRKRGWSSPSMLRRYAASTGRERAVAAAKKHSLADKL